MYAYVKRFTDKWIKGVGTYGKMILWMKPYQLVLSFEAWCTVVQLQPTNTAETLGVSYFLNLCHVV